jgi:hypothetical protein
VRSDPCFIDFTQTASLSGSLTLIGNSPPNDYNSAFALKVHTDNTFEWAVSVRNTQWRDWASGIISDGNGGAIVVGHFEGGATQFGATTLTPSGAGTTTASGSGAIDVYVMQVSAEGSIKWAIKAGGEGTDQAFGVASGGTGYALVTGSFEGNATFGTTSLTSAGAQDVYVMRVSGTDGSIEWAVGAGGTETGAFVAGNAIVSDGSGGAFVAGILSGTATFGTTTLSRAPAKTTSS